MKFYFKFLTCALLVVVYSCRSLKDQKVITEETDKAVAYFDKDAHKLYFTILQLNDVYEIAPIQGGRFGGLARVETIRKQLLQETPHTLLVLAGDFLNPSLLGTLKVNGERLRGQQMVDVLNAMQTDVVAFGNHEFDLKYETLQKRLNESNFDWVSANVRYKSKDTVRLFYKERNGFKTPVSDVFIKTLKVDKSNIKIAFLSACIPSNPKSYVAYKDIYRELKRTYNVVKDSVDVVLALTHLKIDQAKRVAELLPEVPLIMGGHEHVNMREAVGNVKITKADANAKTVYIHRFEFDPVSKKLKIKSELKVVDAAIPSDSQIGAVVNKWQELLKTNIKEVIDNPDEIIYKTAKILNGKDAAVRSSQTNLGTLITKAMRYSYNYDVDCALVNGGSIRIDDVLTGALTPVDIFRVLPYGGPVFKITLRGRLLNQILNFGENAAGTGAYLQYSQVSGSHDSWRIGGKNLQLTQIYTVAISDYLMKGLDIPFLNEAHPDILEVYKPKEQEVSTDIRKVVVGYLKTL